MNHIVKYIFNAPGFPARCIAAILLLSVTAIVGSCGDNNDNPISPEQPTEQSEVSELLYNLWDTSPMTVAQSSRYAAYNTIQGWADGCPAETVFLKYLTADESTAAALEKVYPALECYNLSFQRVLDALKNGLPAGSKPKIWALYNMGIVVQTNDGNYAIDVYHRRGVELAPYIDFYAITHIHADHKWEPLAVAMSNLGKPVLTNFTIDGVDNSQYNAIEQRDYIIGKFNVHSFITHHNSSPITSLAITAFYVDGGGVKLLHSGDSNFIADEFASMKDKDVDFYIFRYAVNALTENNVLGSVVKPKVAVLSHILELGHKDVANSRWSLALGLDRASRLQNDNVAMPFWGDCLTLN